VTAIGIFVQLFNVVYDSCPDRIQMNVADQFFQIQIFLADNGLVTILKKLAAPPVSTVKIDRVTRKKSSHQSSQSNFTGSE
jgi:hypothetical protein